MVGRVDEKIVDLKKNLDILIGFLPDSFEEYKNDFKTKAACERYAEEVIDLAFLVRKEYDLDKVLEEGSIFSILSKEKVIPEELGKRLVDAKGMRNFLVHKYGEINDEIVYLSLSENIKTDVEEFINSVNSYIKMENKDEI